MKIFKRGVRCQTNVSVVKQMEQMSISFKGVFCSSVFILRSIPLIMQTTFCKGVSFDPLSVSQY